MDRGARRAAVHGAAKSRTWLSTHTRKHMHTFGLQTALSYRAGPLQSHDKRETAFLVKCKTRTTGIHGWNWSFPRLPLNSSERFHGK